jgi:type VII secretion protein EccB
MPSRQDQMHSYQFMVSRVVAALVMRETDPAQSPFRRVAAATVAGFALGAFALIAVGAYGVVQSGGSTKWKDANVVIQEKETGAKYIRRDGVLHPVLNYASALLAADGPGARTVTVAHESLNTAPRGVPWGIVDAPDSLPPVKRLTSQGWTVCSRRTGNGVASTLFVGTPPVGGGELVGHPGTELDHPVGKALLLSTPDGADYLVWDGFRHLIHDPDRVYAALLWGNRRIPAATALVNAIPAGQDIRVPDFGADRGKSAVAPAGGRIGQVYKFRRTEGGRTEYLAPVSGGVVFLSTLEATLVLNDPRVGAGRTEAAEIRNRAELPGLIDAARPLAPRDTPGALPESPPELVEQAPTSICTGATGSAEKIRLDPVRYNVAVPDEAGTPTVGASRTGTVLADQIVIAPGSGALVESVSSASAPSGQVCIVTDLGIQYAVPSSDAQARLGYGGRKPVRMPAELVALLPRGPSLDPAVAARAPVGR